MTQLRDARLRKALDAAPDAGLRPPARTREAIHAAAHHAAVPVWRRWLPAPGQGVPWTAGLATVLLAGFVTVLWQREEVPGARADRQQADAVSTAPPPSAPAAPSVTPDAPSAPAAAPPPAAPVQQRAPAAPVARDQAALAGGAGTAAPAAAPTPAPATAPAAAPAPAPAAAPATAAAPAPAAPPVMASAPAAAPAAAPPPRVAAAAPQREAAAALRAAPTAVPTPDWSQVRIETSALSVVVPRPQAETLADLVARALSAPAQRGPVQGAASVQLELGRGADAVGVLSLHGSLWRWSPAGDPRDARNLRVDPALSDALLQETQRALQR
jgi:hypothetical protein